MVKEGPRVRPGRGFASYLADPNRQKIVASWHDLTSADGWLGERAYEIAHHLGGMPQDKWVTIGDGRFGLDSARLMTHGVKNVLATDIDETLLKIAKAQGKLPDYRVEDAEKLSFPNKSFDYAFCKEALHQCTRPWLALYEMLRITKKGVILIEPHDRLYSPLHVARTIGRRLLGHPKADVQFYTEEGNYIFSIRPREIEKIALALDIPQLAFKGLNDAYKSGLEFEALNSPAGRRMRRRLAFRDVLCRLRLDNPTFLMAAIFHVPVSNIQQASMEKAGWSVRNLPRNPYFKEGRI